jgi:hypothetical protein
MVLTGITTIVLLATLAKRELVSTSGGGDDAHQNGSGPAQPNGPMTPGPLKSLKGPSASIDFRHIRSLSKKFLMRMEPPTPIPEYSEHTSAADPFVEEEEGRSRRMGSFSGRRFEDHRGR